MLPKGGHFEFEGKPSRNHETPVPALRLFFVTLRAESLFIATSNMNIIITAESLASLWWGWEDLL